MNDQESERESLTLFVGEGDFSFSANYIVKCKSCSEKVYASCLTDQPLTDRQLKNKDTVIENGGYVFTNVDATRLEYHSEIKELQFSKIIFNFPHISGKMNIRKNRKLVEEFFLSSKTVLKEKGMVIVTLCQGQGGTDIEKVKRKWCDTWQIVSLAASASFFLYRIQPFKASEFATYQCTGFRGQQKPFKTEGALTHVFTLGRSVCLNDDVSKCYLDTILYLQNIEGDLRIISCNSDHPYNKVHCILNNIAIKLFHSIHEETVNILITCMRPPSVYFDVDCIDFDFCNDCMSHLISLFLQKKKSGYTNCIKCSICCIKDIRINSLPFCYLLAYFSDNLTDMLSKLLLFLKYLKQSYSTSIDNLKSVFENDCLQDYISLHSVSHNSSKESMFIESILSLYASYSVYQGEEFFYYSDVDFFLSKNSGYNEVKSDTFKIGSLLQIKDNSNSYFCILFDINLLSQLKYHIMDYRTLLFKSSFYSLQVIQCHSVDIYRPLSLYPPIFIHDVSFYIDQNFDENDLFLVIRNVLGYLIKSVVLIDSHYNDVLHKHSRCYRFTYQSCDKVLSKSKADYIHSKLVRKILENSLTICLR